MTKTGPVVAIQIDDMKRALKSVESQGTKTVVKWTEMGQYGAYGSLKGAKFSFTFQNLGTFLYHCNIHA